MIQVAYDVTAAIPYPGSAPPTTGVARVIREVLSRLAESEELQVATVGCFSGDWNPITTSLRAEQWAAGGGEKCFPSMSAFRSRIGLARVFGPLLLRWEAECERESARKNGPNTQSFALRTLRKLLRVDAVPSFPSGSIDIFCATFLPPPAFLAPGIPRVTFVYDVIPARLPEECGPVPVAMLQQVLSSLDARRDVVIAISEFTKDDFCSLTGFPSARVIVAPLAADSAFHPTANLDEVSEVRKHYGIGLTPYVLSVANLQPRKNLVRTIRAFFIVAQAVPEWDGSLVLAGNNELGLGIEDLNRAILEKPSLSNRVKQIGPVAEKHLAALYSGCECFAFASTYEGFGLPVLEAMRCGAPVVCSNTTSLPEVAGRAAVLVNPTKESEIAEGILAVISKPALRQELSATGIARSKSFSWNETARKVNEAFHLAIS